MHSSQPVALWILRASVGERYAEDRGLATGIHPIITGARGAVSAGCPGDMLSVTAVGASAVGCHTRRIASCLRPRRLGRTASRRKQEVYGVSPFSSAARGVRPVAHTRPLTMFPPDHPGARRPLHISAPARPAGLPQQRPRRPGRRTLWPVSVEVFTRSRFCRW